MRPDHERLKRLKEMADLIFDARTQRLRLENQAREALQYQLAALDRAGEGTGAPWPTSELIAFGYEQWAAVRRAEINVRLARQSAVCLMAAEEAKEAFGRGEILARLAQKR